MKILAYIALLFTFSCFSQTEAEFLKQWGSYDNYIEYCVDSLESDDIEHLQSIARNNKVVFTVINDDAVWSQEFNLDDILDDPFDLTCYEDHNELYWEI